MSNDGICFINSSRTTNVNSNTCYYVYNKSPSNPSAIYSAHIGCYIAPGLLDSNSKRLCTTWSNYIDNLTAVCRTCKAYDNSNPVILPDVSGLNCINVDSYYLNSLR